MEMIPNTLTANFTQPNYDISKRTGTFYGRVVSMVRILINTMATSANKRISLKRAASKQIVISINKINIEKENKYAPCPICHDKNEIIESYLKSLREETDNYKIDDFDPGVALGSLIEGSFKDMKSRFASIGVPGNNSAKASELEGQLRPELREIQFKSAGLASSRKTSDLVQDNSGTQNTIAMPPEVEASEYKEVKASEYKEVKASEYKNVFELPIGPQQWSNPDGLTTGGDAGQPMETNFSKTIEFPQNIPNPKNSPDTPGSGDALGIGIGKNTFAQRMAFFEPGYQPKEANLLKGTEPSEITTDSKKSPDTLESGKIVEGRGRDKFDDILEKFRQLERRAAILNRRIPK